MKRNWHLYLTSLRTGLGSTLIAGLLTSVGAEELPDLNLPPILDGEYGFEEPAIPQMPKVQPARITSAIKPAEVKVAEVGTGLATPPAEPDDGDITPRVAANRGTIPPTLLEIAEEPLATPVEPGAHLDSPVPPRPVEVPVPLERVALPSAGDEETVEVIHERYPDGSIRCERGVKQDAEGNYILHGDWRLFDPKGTLLAEGRYVNNKRDGEWRRFYRGDEVALFGTKPYNEFKGPFVSQATFADGQLDKKWVISDSKQRPVSEIEFQQGERNGTARWYHPNGKIAHEVHFVQGHIEGTAELWDINGQSIRTEVYEAGRRIGMQTTNYTNGQKHVEAECLFAPVVLKAKDDWWTATLATYETVGADERHGRFTVWHPNGLKQREGEFANAKPVGKMTWWYANGQKRLQGYYQQGHAEGTWTWWHENGQKSISGQFNGDQPAGEWLWWNDNGKVAQRIDLANVKETERAALLKQFPLPTSPLR